jgi:DNA-binding transcriptional ArsR family regulator
MSSSSPALPPEVVAFLDQHIFSVTQLEVLLLVQELAPQPCTAAQLSRDAHMPERSLTPWLDAFVDRGLLDRDRSGGYRPAVLEPRAQAVLEAVADCYVRRRVSLSRHVYASNEDPARRFADAFRFRKDKDQ